MKTHPKAFKLLKILAHTGTPVVGRISGPDATVTFWNGPPRLPTIESAHKTPAMAFVSMLTSRANRLPVNCRQPPSFESRF